MPYRLIRIAFDSTGAVADATASAQTWATLTAAKQAAEEAHTVTWRHDDVTRASWAIGTPTGPSAYRTVVIAPAATGLDAILEVLAEVRNERCVADARSIIRDTLDRRDRPAPTTSDSRPQEVPA